MSGGSSEEKSEPASAKKLRQQREKGQIPKGPDLMSAITTGTLIGYVLLQAGTIAAEGGALFDAASQAVTMPFENAAPLMIATIRSALVTCALPPLLVAGTSAVLASLLINKGFIFSLDPVMPKLDKLNPVTGLMNLFKANAWIELAKSVVKAVLLGAALFIVARSAAGPLLEVPACSPGCVPSVLRSMMTPLLGLAALFYLAAGMVDLLIQKWLFLRQNRMTKTELKHERKDTQGNPQIKGEQRRLRREAAKSGRIGLAQATCLLCGPGLAVGLRYVRGETPLPVVVCRAAGERAAEMIKAAKSRNVPLYFDKVLSMDLDRKIKPGKPITSPFFQKVAQVIQRARA